MHLCHTSTVYGLYVIALYFLIVDSETITVTTGHQVPQSYSLRFFPNYLIIHITSELRVDICVAFKWKGEMAGFTAILPKLAETVFEQRNSLSVLFM